MLSIASPKRHIFTVIAREIRGICSKGRNKEVWIFYLEEIGGQNILKFNDSNTPQSLE